LVLSTKRLVGAPKFLVPATKILFVVPNFVAVTKPFFFRVPNLKSDYTWSATGATGAGADGAKRMVRGEWRMARGGWRMNYGKHDQRALLLHFYSFSLRHPFRNRFQSKGFAYKASVILRGFRYREHT